MHNPEDPTFPDRLRALSEPAHIRVWIVEDKRDIRDLMVQVINHEADLDCECGFDSAESMLEVLHTEQPPDVILSDFDLGGMTGAESIAHIMAVAPSTRVVIMTAFTDVAKEREAIAAGAVGFVLKSQRPADFAEILRAAAALPTERMPCRALPRNEPVEAGNEAAVTEAEAEARVVGDALVVWVKKVFKSFGGSSKSVNRRLRMNAVRMPN